jgi:large subunit ribosomal protein L5
MANNKSENKARLQKQYDDSIRNLLMQNMQYANIMQVPKLEKIVINMGVKDAVLSSSAIDGALNELFLITGQKPVATRAKKSIAGFKIREGMAIGCKATLRGRMMYEFLDRLINIALPRVRDFKGFSRKQFDGQGNFSIGLKEQIIFPEINYDKIDRIRGMNIVFVTSAKTNVDAKALLEEFGIPFMN